MKLVLLPGMDGTGFLYQPLLSQLPLSVRSQVITYPVNKVQDYSELLEHIKAQLPQTPFVLLAESFSGILAYKLSLDNSLPIDKMVLVASFLSSPSPRLARFIRLLPISLLLAIPIPNIIFRYFCLNSKTDIKLIRVLRGSITKVDNQVLSNRLRLLLALELPNEVSVTPCLIINPTNDKLVTNRATRLVQNGFENSNIAEINGPHFLAQVKPQQVSKLVCDFLSR